MAALTWNEGKQLSWSQISYQSGLMIKGAATTLADTDSSWKVIENIAYQPHPSGKGIISPFEIVRADTYPWGWQERVYDDHAWLPCKIMPEGTVRKLVPNTLPFPETTSQRFRSVRQSTLASLDGRFIKGGYPVTVPANDSITAIIDQGILTTAFPELLTSGGKDAVISLTYTEALYDSTGNKGNRNDIQGKSVKGNIDQYIADGGSNRLYRPLYYRTFRYIQLTIKTGANPLQLHDFCSVFTAYPFKENASFASDDPSLTAIWNTGWRTARLCAYETYMDCPYYEQLQYVGDTRIQALISYYVSGDDRLVRNAIEQYSNSMLPEGLTHSRYPESVHQVIPPFSLLWISMLHDYWRHRPDTLFVKPEPTRSDCHAWSASPNYDFLATIAGIEPASPGFGTVKIAPNLGMLKHIEGKLPVPTGEILFTMARKGAAGIQGKIILPKGMKGNFYWKGKVIALQPGSQTIQL